MLTFTATDSNNNFIRGGAPMVAADNSCSAVGMAVLNVANPLNSWGAPFKLIACTSDPVTLSTLISIASSDASGGIASNIVLTSFSLDSSTILPLSWQDAVASQNVTIAQLQTQFSTLQTTIGSNGSDPEAIAASTAVFAALLVAAVTIYGLKSVLALFREPGGHD